MPKFTGSGIHDLTYLTKECAKKSYMFVNVKIYVNTGQEAIKQCPHFCEHNSFELKFLKKEKLKTLRPVLRGTFFDYKLK